ncbi:MAG: glycine cleavage system protein H [Verrucomicrobia bacterium]|nr:glycine cleavage system protein H [Verrucomicrobiota bacterium]
MPEYLEMTADKFTFRVATDRLYSPEGVWILPQPDSTRVRVGLADYLQQHNGDVAFANVKPVGSKLAAGEQFAEIETIKAIVELHAPVSGTVVEVNAALNASPEAINQAPYEAGWLAVVEPAAWETERPKLLDAAAYFAVMQGQVQEDLKGL